MYTYICVLKTNFIRVFREDKIIAKVNRRELDFENGIIHIEYSAIDDIAKVNSRKWFGNTQIKVGLHAVSAFN